MILIRFAFVLLLASRAFASTPDVAAIVRKLGENTNDAAQTESRNAFSYDRRSRVDYLTENQELKKQVIRLYRIAPENGRPVTRLVSVNGKPHGEKEAERRSSARETGDKSRSLVLSEELLSRYEFTYAGQDRIAERPAWILRFKPRPDLESDGFFDKMLNAVSGILWVDIEEGQLAKAEIFLSKKISFFGGFAGAIERLDVTIVQRRVEPNVWLSEAAFVDFAGRKLLSDIRFRCYETCTGFQKEVESAAAH